MTTQRPAPDHARTLRRASTDAEKRLWRYLRDRQVAGFKFRRQVPIGPYVVDFVCLEARLIVEVDGGQHAVPGIDAVRTAYLKSEAFRVIRFWNNDVLANVEGVIRSIEQALLESQKK